MPVKDNTKRYMIAISDDDYKRLVLIMFDLKTRQLAKAIHYLLDQYEKAGK